MKGVKFLVLSFLTLLLLNSCGDKKEKKKDGFSYEQKTETTSKNQVQENDVTITSNDEMQFNKTEIRVKSGKKVKITLRHIGKMPKNVMGHNFVLLKKGINLTAFGNKAASASNNEYIPEGTTDVIAHTKIIGAGETDVIEFDAPEPGTYNFLCSFPGHYAMMKGEFIVE